MLEALAVEAELASQAAERAKEAASAKRRLAQAKSRSARASRASSRQDVTNSNVSVVEEVQAVQPAELPIRERGGGLLNFFSFNNSAPPRQEIREEQMNYQVHASADAEDSHITAREARAMKEVSERDRQLEELKRKIAIIEKENKRMITPSVIMVGVTPDTPMTANTHVDSVFLTPRPESVDLIDLNTPSPQKKIDSQQAARRVDIGAGVRDWLDDVSDEQVGTHYTAPADYHGQLPEVKPMPTFVRSEVEHVHNVPKRHGQTFDVEKVAEDENSGDRNDLGGGPPGLPNPSMFMNKWPPQKVKEAETIKLAQLPEIAQFDAWKIGVRKQVMAASGRRDEAFQWIMEVEDTNFTYEDLSDCTNFETLDAKLSAAISVIANKGNIGREITNMEKLAAKKRTILSSRQLLRIIYKQYETDAEKGNLYEMRDLLAITYPGDDHIELFLANWNETVDNMEENPGENTLRGILHELVKGSRAISHELSRYKTAKKGTYEKSYDFLLTALINSVDDQRKDRNREALVKAKNRAPGTTSRSAMVASSTSEAESSAQIEPATAAAPATPAKTKVGICYSWQRGSCGRGARCAYSHSGEPGSAPPLTDSQKKDIAEKRSKQVCRAHAAGKCRFGDKCQYAHSGIESAAGACTMIDEDGEEEEFETVFTAPVLDKIATTAPCGMVQEWIIDTGTENHLVSRGKCDEVGDEFIDLDRPLRLATANGEILAKQRVRMNVSPLGTTVEPLVLENTVDAISVGRLVMDDKYSFFWKHGEDAYFQDQDGKIIGCSTRGYVPVIKSEGGARPIANAVPGVGNEDSVQHDDGPGEANATESREERMKKEATSIEHLITHRPKSPYCWVCGLTKMTAKQARRLDPDDERRIDPSVFGEHICVDHIVLNNVNSIGMNGERAALFIMDMHTRFTDLVPVANKSAEEALKALRFYLGDVPATCIYSDNSKELTVAIREMDVIHQTATPHRPQTNAFAERGIRTMLEGTRASLLQAGLPHRFWPMAGRHHAFATAVTDQCNGLPSPWWLKHGKSFDGWVLPFGSLVHYRPPRPILKSLPKFAPRTIPGIFLGWHLEPGCGFRGDYLVVALDAFKTPCRKSYHAHRVKELVSFEPDKFPLQAAMMESMIEVRAPENQGDVIWPDQLVHGEDADEEEDDGSEKIDVQYKEVFGEAPPGDMSYQDKYNKIAIELFGDLGDEDAWDHKASGETEIDTAGGNDEAKEVTSQIPRGKKIHLPKKIVFTTAAATEEKKDKTYQSFIEGAKELGSPAERRLLTKVSDRRVIEYCCGEESLIGSRATLGCMVVRLTIRHDLTTDEGLAVALRAITDTPAGEYVHLWASLPCTAGSPWQRMNARHPGADQRMADHMETFEKLFNNFTKVAEKVMEKGGDVSYEWPTACSLWKLPSVKKLIDDYSMNVVNMHGCAAGLRSRSTGEPIKKPWSVATTSPAMVEGLCKFQCPGKGEHPSHESCAGQETKRTEAYTPAMVDAIHEAVREEALCHRARASKAAVAEVRSEHDDAVNEMRMIPEPSGHREKNASPGLWCAMVTKTLHPGDPLTRCPEALECVQSELDELRKVPTWDEANPVEADDLKKINPNAHVAGIFPIIGIKHWEVEADRKWKGRIVFGGHKVKTATGQWALFQEIGAVPSTMSACRALLAAYSVTRDAKLYQSDCTRAYIQAHMKGTDTYVRLPKAWWPKSWGSKYRDPLCQLLRALHGHPDAGNFWADKIGNELKRLEFTEVDGWSSVYVLDMGPSHVACFVLYVDDLVMFGSHRVDGIIVELRKTISMDDPSDLQKYLGVFHQIVRKEVHGETITEIRFDMEHYFRSAIDDYIKMSGSTLTKVTSPFAPRLEKEELDKLLGQDGKMAKNAASLVMKLMYGVRMALPHLCVIVGRLSSQITKWTADSDRRLHRVYCYLHGALHMKLTGCLSTSDIAELKILAWPDADLNGDYLDTKSTSGFFIEMVGKEGRGMPLSWGSRKQGSTSQHTAEAEMVSLAACLRNEAIPLQHLVQSILKKPIDLELCEDNAATVISATKGYSPSMRHLPRTQRISVGLINEMINEEPRDGEGRISITKVETAKHKGDLFTKELDGQMFANALAMIRVTDQSV